LKKYLLIPLFLTLAGCAQNQITGRNQFIVVSERMAISESAAAYNQMMGQLDKKKQIEATEHERVKKVHEITNRLIVQAIRLRPETASWKWDVKVINDPKVVNAFCMAGGKMAIYTGMFEQLKPSDDEIAQVMGHEIAHALANHTQERMSIAMTQQIGFQVAAIALAGREGAGLALTGAQMASLVAISLPNSREGESEADRIGIELAARAGYDPAAAVTLWEKMEKVGGGKGPPQFLSTHPSPANRRQALAGLGPQMEPLYKEAKANPSKDVTRFVGGSGGDNVNERAVHRPENVNERAVQRPGEAQR
jgi:predicted Zn-dependent protease